MSERSGGRRVGQGVAGFGALLLAGSLAAATVRVELADAEVRTALQALAREAGIALVLSDAVQGRLSLHLPPQPPRALLHDLAEARGWVLEPVGRLHWLGPPEELQARWSRQQELQRLRETRLPLARRWLAFEHLRATDVMQLLQSRAGAAAGPRWLGPQGQVEVDVRGNRVLLVDQAERLAALVDWLQAMDRPLAQVLVETRIAALTQTHARAQGFRWRLTRGGVAGVVPLAVAGPEASVLSYGVVDLTGLSLDAELSALESDGAGEVIARPSIMTQSLQTARIASGQQIPYQETTQSGASTTRFVNAELSLEVTPSVLTPEQLQLQLQLSHDNPGEIQSTGARAIETNRLQTQVVMAPGQTLVLGGIFRHQEAKAVSRVPFLGNIPVLGRLFRRDTVRRDKQELLIFVTPRLVENDEMASAPEAIPQATGQSAERGDP